MTISNKDKAQFDYWSIMYFVESFNEALRTMKIYTYNHSNLLRQQTDPAFFVLNNRVLTSPLLNALYGEIE